MSGLEQANMISFDAIVNVLATGDVVALSTLRALPECAKLTEREFGLVFHRACEYVRVSGGRDFGVRRGHPGVYELKSWTQVASRGRRWRRKGQRAIVRGLERLDLAKEMAPDGERDRLSRAADRERLRIELSGRRSR